VLDVALRLQQLLLKASGFEVVLTRDTDIFIPLEERTAIANRAGADLFLFRFANASRNPKAHGVETYFLNFASTPTPKPWPPARTRRQARRCTTCRTS
jgi:N-acetylmuramoyl-L-alanine amidase